MAPTSPIRIDTNLSSFQHQHATTMPSDLPQYAGEYTASPASISPESALDDIFLDRDLDLEGGATRSSIWGLLAQFPSAPSGKKQLPNTAYLPPSSPRAHHQRRDSRRVSSDEKDDFGRCRNSYHLDEDPFKYDDYLTTHHTPPPRPPRSPDFFKPVSRWSDDSDIVSPSSPTLFFPFSHSQSQPEKASVSNVPPPSPFTPKFLRRRAHSILQGPKTIRVLLNVSPKTKLPSTSEGDEESATVTTGRLRLSSVVLDDGEWTIVDDCGRSHVIPLSPTIPSVTNDKMDEVDEVRYQFRKWRGFKV